MKPGRRPQEQEEPSWSAEGVPRVRFVLVEPQFDGNVGAAARALKNLGFSRLVLVRPQCDRESREARAWAVDGRDVLERAEVHETLDAALAGARAVVGTTRRRGKQRQPHFRLDRIAEELARLAASEDLAVLFGQEARGLTDRELDRCTHVVHLAAAEEFPSFNLAQAVLLVAYELRRAMLGSVAPEPRDPPAEHVEREAMYDHLQRALCAIGFLRDDTAEPMMRRLRRLFGRAAPTTHEVRVLRGIAQQALWLAERTAARSATVPPATAPADVDAHEP